MVALSELIELRVRPVVRPLFFTAWPTDASRGELEMVPISRIAPSLLTNDPPRDLAIAASTFEPSPNRVHSVRLATVSLASKRQPVSIKPAWLIGSPATAWRLLPPSTWSPAKTWVLLRMYWLPPESCTSAPSVPEQQNPFAVSCALPPETP